MIGYNRNIPARASNRLASEVIDGSPTFKNLNNLVYPYYSQQFWDIALYVGSADSRRKARQRTWRSHIPWRSCARIQTLIWSLKMSASINGTNETWLCAPYTEWISNDFRLKLLAVWSNINWCNMLTSDRDSCCVLGQQHNYKAYVWLYRKILAVDSFFLWIYLASPVLLN